MPPLPGFSDNPLITRQDVVRASRALIAPLRPYFSPACARVKLPITIGTNSDEVAAQLEGFARPLFVVGALLHAGEAVHDLLEPWIRGFEAGTDPDHPEFWGAISDRDQRMVEAEMIAYALLSAPHRTFWDRFDEKTKLNVTNWLRGLQGKELYSNNWLWFRVMSSVALIKVCGVDHEELRPQMEHDFGHLDAMYLQDGWSSDGVWPDAEDVLRREAEEFETTGKTNQKFWCRQADYYSGSFAIQFSQLLYVKFASDLDPARAERYRQQARQFGAQFWMYFDERGAAIPFGRSLTYRFACAAFFAAVAFAEVDDLPEPLDKQGTIKGLLLRHLRWWREHSDDMFHTDGTVNIGWLYPNMFLSEDYSSPQSVYWALKAFVVIGLSADKGFWTEPESPYPKAPSSTCYLHAPRQIICNHPSGNHHFLLNPSQYFTKPFKNTTAKYSKFAYSSTFPFSVAVGSTVPGQLAPDNCLLLSRDGTGSWATKRICTYTSLTTTCIKGPVEEKTTVFSIQWYPWADRQVSVTTTLVPPSNRWPDWHLRVHRIKVHKDLKILHTMEGGFCITKDDSTCVRSQYIATSKTPRNDVQDVADSVNEQNNGVIISADVGASGISTEQPEHSQAQTIVSALRLEANTNLRWPRTLVPLVEHSISDLVAGDEVVLVVKVFAISTNGSGQPTEKDIHERWSDQPLIRFPNDSNDPELTEYISIPPP